MLRLRSLAAILVAVLLALTALAPVASAQTDDDSRYPLTTTPPTVLDQQEANDPPAVAAAQVQSGQLPVTGSDIVGLAVIGLVAVGVGLVLVRYQRGSAARS